MTADAGTMNGHFAGVGDHPNSQDFEHGVQVIDEEKQFNVDLGQYLQTSNVSDSGFNYHLISVFGSQSTGKSTLLNALFGTQFSVMSEAERRQTTKGIWLSKNKNEGSGDDKMADNILVMDVEGTDGRERGEDQDFERKSALFALATSEVLIVNLWEHQVGLYQGANMGLLKTVFEVNLQIFLRDKQSTPRSLLFFVIRDHIGATPLANLRNTLIQDLTKIWSSISKPQGLENSRIEDYFDFGFAALPHKLLQADKFVSEVHRLGTRFRAGNRSSKVGAHDDHELEGGVFLPEYHRRIPADGFSVYAEGIWDQIVNNKDLDLPTQQELLAQFRCDEIAKEVLVAFDEAVTPFEDQQLAATRAGRTTVLEGLGDSARAAREKCFSAFETQASRYHKGVFASKKQELGTKIDSRLKALFVGQLQAAHKNGLARFSEVVQNAVKAGQKAGGTYEFAEIVNKAKEEATEAFKSEAENLAIADAAWTRFAAEETMFQTDLDSTSKKLRQEEMSRLAARVERWVKSRLGDAVALEFSKLGSGRGSGGIPEGVGKPPTEKNFWDRVWNVFDGVVMNAQGRFTDRAQSFEASTDEVDAGLWRLRCKSWSALRQMIGEEMKESNILLKLRENFEDRFRYDDAGVPRIWQPTDDIEGVFTKAWESSSLLIPLLATFKLSETSEFPDLPGWIGAQPAGADDHDEELPPIGGIDDDKSLEEEMTMLSENKRQELAARFKNTADGVFVEAKRSAIGGVTQIPLWFYGILVALGWNELVMVLRNPMLFVFMILIAGGAYIANTMNLLGPMFRMANAAANQGVDMAKQSLREFVENSDTARAALALPAKGGDAIAMDRLDSQGKRAAPQEDDDF
jgi:hypothetical protein